MFPTMFQKRMEVTCTKQTRRNEGKKHIILGLNGKFQVYLMQAKYAELVREFEET